MIFDIINKDPGFISSHVLKEFDSAGTYDFASTDSREDFARNLKRQPDDWYYRTRKVEYTLNSHKFRTKEFKDIDWKNSIVLFGDSYTFGVGVTDSHTISSCLERITGKYVVNLGSPGLSNGAIAYNSYYLKENYPEPLAVVKLWTNMVRWFYVTPEKRMMAMVYSDMGKDYSAETDGHHNRINTIISNNIMYMKMSNALWKHHPNHIQTCMADYSMNFDVKMLSITQKVFPEAIQFKSSWELDNTARDCSHGGKETLEKIAKMIASNLKL